MTYEETKERLIDQIRSGEVEVGRRERPGGVCFLCKDMSYVGTRLGIINLRIRDDEGITIYGVHTGCHEKVLNWVEV